MPPQDELYQPFEVLEPAQRRGPIIFNSPHSGCVYPHPFLATSRLELATLRRSEDSFVDELVIGVVRRGHPLMRAHFPRCYVDVNREPYELDPRMFEGRLPPFANTRSMRVAGGLGTVARVVGDAQEIYDQRIPVDEALRRIEQLYKPYHRALRRLFTQVHRDVGAAVLIDCHSMPSALSVPDIVLGDRYGASATPQLTARAEAAFAREGFSVARNTPYAGGHTTVLYGKVAAGCHALQVEINRALYLDEDKIAKKTSFESVRARLTRAMEFLTAMPLSQLGGGQLPLAAE